MKSCLIFNIAICFATNCLSQNNLIYSYFKFLNHDVNKYITRTDTDFVHDYYYGDSKWVYCNCELIPKKRKKFLKGKYENIVTYDPYFSVDTLINDTILLKKDGFQYFSNGRLMYEVELGHFNNNKKDSISYSYDYHGRLIEISKFSNYKTNNQHFTEISKSYYSVYSQQIKYTLGTNRIASVDLIKEKKLSNRFLWLYL